MGGFCLFRILYLPLKISNLPTKMIFSFRSGKVRILAKKYPQMWLRSKIWMRAFKPPRLKSHLGGLIGAFFVCFLANQKDIVGNQSCQHPEECPGAYISYEMYPANYSDNRKKDTSNKKKDSNRFPKAKP